MKTKTIEERAKEYASKKGDISLSPIYNEALASVYEEAYIAGAEEQKRIDIDKACSILEDMAEGRLGKRFISEFKNKLKYGALERD